MADRRDDFSDRVKRMLAARVGYRCSNPDCRAWTSGPQLDPAKAINIGVAAHITAAAPNGPRYSPAITSTERTGVTNGIWLCQNCAKLIDSDLGRFTAEMILSWKAVAESTALFSIGGADLEIRKDIDSLKGRQAAREGFCYLNRDGIDEMWLEMGLDHIAASSYIDKVHEVVQYLDSQGQLAISPQSKGYKYVACKCHLSFIDDDEKYLCFRADKFGFQMNMSKIKTTIWPWETKISPLAHVRLALRSGLDLKVFGEWYSASYLRPHAAMRLATSAFGVSNTLC